jgi:hypothetical protein
VQCLSFIPILYLKHKRGGTSGIRATEESRPIQTAQYAQSKVIPKYYIVSSSQNPNFRQNPDHIVTIYVSLSILSSYLHQDFWLPTAAARVRVRVWSSGICGGQSGAGAGFLRVLRFPLPIFIPPISPSS